MKTNLSNMESQVAVVGAPITAAPTATATASKKTNKTNRIKKNKKIAVAAQHSRAVEMTTNPPHMQTNPSFAHTESIAVTVAAPTASEKTNKNSVVRKNKCIDSYEYHYNEHHTTCDN